MRPRTEPTRRDDAGLAFQHRACLYGSDRQFLSMAVPFLQEGLSQGEPVLAVTTPSNLELLSSALGSSAADIDYGESPFFGRRPAQRMAAFHRYWRRRGPWADGGRVRILAEPAWPGRSAAEITAWTRMEAALNVTLADTGISMICPYDRRSVSPGILAAAGRTHPSHVTGVRISPSADYDDPAAVARSCESSPLPEPPSAAVATDFTGDLRSLRLFIAGRAAAHGLAAERAELLVLAASEVAAYLKGREPGTAAVRTWEQPGAVICDFRQAGEVITDPFLGLRPAGLQPQAGDGLWLASQICERLDIRSGADGSVIRLQVPTSRNEELAQPGHRYLA